MPSAPIPQSEQARLEALYRYEILDTKPEDSFDNIAQLAARVTGAPIVLISFVDANRQWFKARIGLSAREMDRCVAFCGYTILSDEVLEVCDASVDARFADNPLVIKRPGIRYYAGAPIITREKLNLGSLCVIDTAPRLPLSTEDRQTLKNLAALIVDQLELRVAFKERAETFANIAHEIRSPLNAALGFINMIHSRTFGEIEPKPYSDYIDHIHVACNQVVDVISEFLDFFKSETGYLVLDETQFDLSVLLDECVSVVKALAASSGLALRVTIDREALEIVADRQRIRQILLNLLVNAAKFTPRGGRISISAGINATGEFRVSVVDTGIGIAPNEIAKVLKPFGQISQGAAKGIVGSGLGLSFAKRLTELHGGILEIESQVDQGTEVIVRLPANRVVPQMSDNAANSRKTA